MLIIVDADITVSCLSRALGMGFSLRPEMHHGETRYKLSRAHIEERRPCVCGNLIWPGEHPHCREPESSQ